MSFLEFLHEGSVNIVKHMGKKREPSAGFSTIFVGAFLPNSLSCKAPLLRSVVKMIS